MTRDGTGVQYNFLLTRCVRKIESPGAMTDPFLDEHRRITRAETVWCRSDQEAPTRDLFSAPDPTCLCHRSNHAKVTSFAYILRKAPVSG